MGFLERLAGVGVALLTIPLVMVGVCTGLRGSSRPGKIQRM